MRTRHAFLTAAFLTLFSCIVSAQQPREEVLGAVRSDRVLAAGLDKPYETVRMPSTPAPKGYEPVYVSHYGRHGSRYAYTSNAYTVPLEALKAADAMGNLTPRGRRLLSDLDAFWKTAQYKVGDLAPLGWEQQAWIAGNMVHSFPSAFGKGSVVDACSSASIRSILSMASCCAGISREAPDAAVYAHQGILDIQATRPNTGKNPFRYKGPEHPFPYPESQEEYFLLRFPSYRDALGRIFTDPSAALGNVKANDFFFDYYMLIAGMNSIPESERIDVGGLLTDEEFALLWEIDAYARLRQYLAYRTPCSSIVDDIVAKADRRLAERKRGADLRFGHDHVVMSLMMIMNIAGSGNLPGATQDFICSFRTYQSPMAANIQFVFYVPKRGKSGDALVKVLLNGEESSIGSIDAVSGPYYKWTDVKEYFAARTAMFVNR